MVSDLLDNEADLKYFCEENNLKSGNIYRFDFPSDLCHDTPGRSAVHRDLILIWVECDFSMTIEVFKFLNEKLSKLGEEREIVRPNNTGSIGGNKTKSRKRSAEDFILSDHPGNKVHISNSANQEWFTFLTFFDVTWIVTWFKLYDWNQYFYVGPWHTVFIGVQWLTRSGVLIRLSRLGRR